MRTRDDLDSQIKPLPRLRYLRKVMDDLVQYEVLLLPKSRQQLVTWTVESYLVWRCEESGSTSAGVLPQTGEDADDHIQDRCKEIIFEHQPDYVKARFTLAQSKGMLDITHRDGKPWGSHIAGYAKTAGASRGDTNSILFFDEWCFQPGARKTWRASTPTRIGRGTKRGQVIIVSSIEPGTLFMDQLICEADKEVFRRARQIARFGLGEAA